MNAPAKDTSWHALNVDLEPSSREAVEYALMEAGALGTVTNDLHDGLLRVVGYFEVVPIVNKSEANSWRHCGSTTCHRPRSAT